MTFDTDAGSRAQRSVVLFIGQAVTIVVEAVALLDPGRHFTHAEQLAVDTRENTGFAFAFVCTADLSSARIVFVDLTIAIVIQAVTDFIDRRDAAEANNLAGFDIADQVAGTTLANIRATRRSDGNTFVCNAIAVVSLM